MMTMYALWLVSDVTICVEHQWEEDSLDAYRSLDDPFLWYELLSTRSLEDYFANDFVDFFTAV